jgi:signal transduction histidine kinase
VPATASELPAQARLVSPPVSDVHDRPRGTRAWPRWTIRLRLTLLYGSLFLLAGAVLLAITYGLVAGSGGKQSVLIRVRPDKSSIVTVTGGQDIAYFSRPAPTGGKRPVQLPSDVPPAFRKAATTIQQQAQVQIERQRQAQLGALLTKSIIALGIMALVSIGLGWVMAGRALRPLRTMSLRARGISERNLHERLALAGPDDELKELGDTFDGLLARLEMAFDSQRRFVANASHELRTPITVGRTLAEVALADPHADVKSLRGACERVVAAGEEQERLIEALLILARSERGLETHDVFDLAEIAREKSRALAVNQVAIDASGIETAAMRGERALAERLVANLIGNAVRHNEPGGWVRVRTATVAGRARLEIVNSGPAVAPADVPGLLEPFHRGGGGRSADGHGLGLGLSIVAAIARAHQADLSVTAREGGGLNVQVTFPPA